MTPLPTESPVPLILGLTTRFREAQDRLYLAAKDDAGQVTGMWLTRRLADRLVRKLAARLDGAAQVAQAHDASRAAVHVWQQSVAQAQHAPVAPVPEPAPSKEALIESVDLAQVNQRQRLVFRCAGGTALALVVDNTQLRQWLAMLYRNYRLGEWATEGVWPAWIDTAMATAPAGDEFALH